MIKIYILIFSFFMVGCGGLGVDFVENRTIAITKPPFQIVVSGDIKKEDKIIISEIIDKLIQTDFKDYNFSNKIIVQVSGSEADVVKIIESKND